MRKNVGTPYRKDASGHLRSRATPDFQIGDRVRLTNAELEGVVISKSYGNVRDEVRCDNGHYVRELLPEALSLIEKPTSR